MKSRKVLKVKTSFVVLTVNSLTGVGTCWPRGYVFSYKKGIRPVEGFQGLLFIAWVGDVAYLMKRRNFQYMNNRPVE